MQNQGQEFTIRKLQRSEMQIPVDWAAVEGWNPGLYDADCFYAADPNGFLLGLIGDEPIATISVVRYGEPFGFLGFYIVKPSHRGQGYGIKIWNAGLAYLAGRNVGLDGVVAQQQNYMKSGFRLAYRNIRYEGKGGGAASEGKGIVPLSNFPVADVIKYDAPFFPADRSSFLKAWINQPESVTLGVTRAGRLAGYGMLRVCRAGFKIGPLFADTPADAEALLAALLASATVDAPVYFDVPEINRVAVDLAEAHGMHVIFETARMYTHAAPQLPLAQIFGVTSFELG